MQINEHTKIATLLKAHPEALETIVALSPDFKKLRNPLLRKLMAGRTSIGMAARIGGSSPEVFFKALAPLGFEHSHAAHEHEVTVAPPPAFIRSLNPDKLVTLDVRPILAGGEDPLKKIQQQVKSLEPGQVLCIVNTFEPTPLIRLLEQQGYEAFVSNEGPELVETYFCKKDESANTAAKEPQQEAAPAEQGWEALLEQYAAKLTNIDVRHLEMPGPMMAILEALETLPPDGALYVTHKRIPVFLLSELRDRNFDYRIREVGPAEVYLLIFRASQ